MAAEQGAASARGQHLREVLDELGPTFVKFGQLLSTRPDVVPPDIVVELRGLQDDVRPFPFEQARAGDRGGAREHARAAVPRLRARAGRGRVDRPGASRDPAERASRRGQGAAAGRAAEDRGRPRAALPGGAARARAHPRARLRRHARSSWTSSRARSGRSSTTGRRRATRRTSTATSPATRTSTCRRSYWQYTRPRVLTLEWIDGIQLADVDMVTTTLEERREIAYRITEAWMTMIFRHGFFHGDPHPANILLPVEAGTIGLVDFGAVGTLTDDDMSKLTGLFIDAANENIDQLPKRLSDLGVRYPKEREGEFLAELRELYYRYYGASLSEVDPIQVIREGFQLIYSMNLHLPARFLLLDRTIATLGSVGVELYPDFNVFEVARPYARDLMLERFTPQRVARRARREAIRLRAGARRGAVPVPRLHGGDPRRPDRGRLRAQGARRVHAQARRRVQPARGRAHRRRRADRLEPDRDLRQGRAAGARRERRSRSSASRSRPCSGSGSSGAWSARAGCRPFVTLSRERTSGASAARAPSVGA